ncbi:hypothetical protein L7F22_026441 [Adiantum nelumboides]|nr:hypothetical protein [Adiantum nelumboides]
MKVAMVELSRPHRESIQSVEESEETKSSGDNAMEEMEVDEKFDVHDHDTEMQERMRQARQAVTDKLQRFERRDIFKICRLYEQSIEDNGIQDRDAIDGFHLIVVPELRTQIVELQAQQGTDWQEFKKALKEEYFYEGSQ